MSLRLYVLMIICALAFGKSPRVSAQSRMDSVEIGLVTCSPHEEIYSLYGHTALRYHDLHTGEDLVFNYGIFRADQDNFVWHFAMGHTDYELGVSPTEAFCSYYKAWGSQVTEQVLQLTDEEKARIAQALGRNIRPENRVFRYNIFYDNCATRPRDLIEANLTGTVNYAPRPDYEPSLRSMAHQCTAGHAWTTFGNEILLGLQADLPTTQREQQFLPANLRHDFDRATVTREGRRIPLVKERRELVAPGVQVMEDGFPLPPLACSLMLLAVALAVTLYEWLKNRGTRCFDLVLMTAAGLAGCILTLMLFSDHPTTETNLQVLLLNPLPLFFLWHVTRRRKTYFFHVWLALTLLFLVGGLWQGYAEGMYGVAACVLLRSFARIRHFPVSRSRFPA